MIRKATIKDAKAVADIYNEYVANSDATFETDPVSEKEMAARIAEISASFPYLAYETDGGEIAGYCYAHAWKERAAYADTWENAVYLSPAHTGKGIRRILMERLIEECRNNGCHALIACITAGNEASGALHIKLGFRQASHFRGVGFKFGRRLDVTDYELLLS